MLIDLWLSWVPALHQTKKQGLIPIIQQIEGEAYLLKRKKDPGAWGPGDRGNISVAALSKKKGGTCKPEAGKSC